MENNESDFAKDVVGIAINSNQGEIGPDPQAAKADGGAAKEKGADKEKPAASDEKTYPKVRAKLEKAGLKFRVFVDHGNKVSDLFQAATTPHSYVIDQKGVLRYAGALDGTAEKKDDRAYVREAIEAVLAGKEVKDKETKPYG